MEPEVYLYSKNGWLSRASQFTSDRSKAAGFPLSDAIERCKRYKENQVIVVPVLTSHMDAIG